MPKKVVASEVASIIKLLLTLGSDSEPAMSGQALKQSFEIQFVFKKGATALVAGAWFYFFEA